MKRVSIVIPCYNYGRYVGEAVESALSQTYPEIETIVMDDGSIDDTPERVRLFDGRIRYFRTPNQGHGATLNEALRHVSGDYYVCLDADNMLMPDYVARTVAILNAASPETAFVYTQRLYFGLRSGVSCSCRYDFERLKERNYIDTCSLVRTQCGRKYGYDTALKRQVDYDFYLTLAENGYKGELLDEPLFRYRIHEASVSQSISRQYGQLEAIKPIIKKHAALYSRCDRIKAIKAARNRIQLAIINNRQSGRPLSIRIKDLWVLITARPVLVQIWNQMRYTVTPELFVTRE